MIEISSITQLPAHWCDILTKGYHFVATACTRAKYESDPNWHDPILEKKSEHIYYDSADKGWLIVVEEEQITEEILPKYVEELNKHSSEQYTYNPQSEVNKTGRRFLYHGIVGKTAEEAFRSAVKQAQYDHGHAGYTGTIADCGER